MASTAVKLLRTILAAAAAAVGVALLLGPARRRPAPPRDPHFAGNDSSGVFHHLRCRMYDADSEAPTFATREEALAAGYRPCGICRP